MSAPNAATAPLPVLHAQGIRRRYGAVTIFQDLNLSVVAGDVVLLLGPNGAGKTSLLRCLAGLARPQRGAIRIDGQDPYAGNSARGIIGFLPHDSMLYDDLTARENLQFTAAMHRLDNSTALIDHGLDAAGLTHHADSRVQRFSRGMVQRLALARTLLHSPRVLLLDEPFTGLDTKSAAALRARLETERARGCAIVCVTHEPAEIWEIATRVVVLAGKAILFDAVRPDSIESFRDTYARLVS